MSYAPCPFCKRPVHVEAIKCRHCRRWIAEPPPGRFRFVSRDFGVPLLIVLAGIALLAYVLVARRGGPLPAQAPAAAASVAAADAGAPKSPAPSSAGPVSSAEEGAIEDPDDAPGATPAPARRPASARPEPPGQPAPPSSASRPLVPAAPPEPAPEPEPTGTTRHLKSDVFGYSIRLQNEEGWQMGFAGISRHGLVRRDDTARIQIWVELFTSAADAGACLRAHLNRLAIRFRRAGLKVRARPVRRKKSPSGQILHVAEREARGAGPRRHAGLYQIAFAAHGPLCYGFEGYASVPASRAARREVGGAFETFDVDPAVLAQAARADELRQKLRAAAAAAEASRNGLALLDAATALASLWPDESLPWQLLGASYLMAARPRAALQALRRSLEGRPAAAGEHEKLRRFSIWTLIADAHARLKQWSEASRALGEARRILPDHPGLKYAEACIRAQRGQVDRAIDALEVALRSWPTRAAPPRIPHGLATQIAFARGDARLRKLRTEPRFEVLLRRFEARARKAQ